ncbi:MAG TPA: methyltransferase domain-containing protein [Spirochaetota bacterium]|nr:methyltransferase domain-containing protein [Spirochaetota bacterium]
MNTLNDEIIQDGDPNARKAFGLVILKNSHSEIRRIKKQDSIPSIHGNKFWYSSYFVMDYLLSHPLKPGSHVMEVGCGWGLAGIFCAKLFNARVTGIDADPDVFPYLHLHAKINNVSIHTEKKTFQRITSTKLSDVDILIGSDICFWDNMVRPLFNLFKRAMKSGVKQIVLADPGRSPFRELCELCSAEMKTSVLSREVSIPTKNSGSLLVIKPGR